MENSSSALKRRRSSEGSQVLGLRPAPPLPSHRILNYDPTTAIAQALNPAHIHPDELRDQVQEAVDIALSSHFKQYATVRCLLISWHDDDLGCLQEITELQNLFSASYGFSCEDFRIPSQDSERQLRLKLTDFDRAIGPDDLFILYYGGHAAMPRPYDDFIWAATQDSTAATLNWTILQSIVEQMPSDALLILDCCYAAHVTRGAIPGKKEVLAASGWEHTAIAGVQNRSSFTAFLTHALEQLALSAHPFTISDLFSRIISTTSGPNGQRLARTPLHCQLRCQEPRRPIVLCPHAPASGTLTPQLAAQPSRPIPSYPRMIVAVSFSGGLENTTATRIKQWLTSGLPSEVRDVCISVELAAHSNSALTILTMPMPLWLALSTHPAVRPCGLITKASELPTSTDVWLTVVVRHRVLKTWVTKWRARHTLRNSIAEHWKTPTLATSFPRTAKTVHIPVGKILLEACHQGNVDIAKRLLRGGTSPDLSDGYDTPLVLAIKRRHADVVELLLSWDADVEKRGDLGITPLMAAAAGGHIGIVKMLLYAGADVTAEGSADCPNAYEAAAANNRSEVMKLLLDAAAGLMPKNRFWE